MTTQATDTANDILKKLADHCKLTPERMLAMLVLEATSDHCGSAYRGALGLSVCDPLPWHNGVGAINSWAEAVLDEMWDEQSKKEAEHG